MSFFKNSIWSFFSKMGGQLIGLLSNIILARLLYPELFGILGMAMVFSGLVFVVQEAGLSSYIIYKKNLRKNEITTTFWLNFLLSIFFFIVIYFISIPLANFYNEVKVGIIIKYIGFGILVGSLGITGRALLIKNKQFKKITLIDLLSESIASSIAIIMAILSFELLAITSRLVIKPLLQTIFILFINWRNVIGKFHIKDILSILPYSSKVLIGKVFVYFDQNIDYFLIGKLLGSKELGLYTIAYQWSVVARFYISGSLAAVVFSEISSIQNEKEKIKKLYLQLISKLSFLTFPLCTGLLIVAPEFISILYGDLWSEAVKPLQILLLAGVITSIGTTSGAIFQGVGKPEIEMRLNIISVLIFIPCIYIGSMYGLIGVSLAVLVRTLIIDSIKTVYVIKIIECKLIDYVKSMFPNIVCTLGLAISLLISRYMLNILSNDYVRLFIFILLGSLVYLVLISILNKKTLVWYVSKIPLKYFRNLRG